MELNAVNLERRELWEEKGIKVPVFSFKKMRVCTEQNPQWLHFGAGNIFRSFIAPLQQDLLEKGRVETGIITAETFDFDIIDKIYAPFENLSILVTYKADGTIQKQVVAGVAEAVKADPADKRGMDRLRTIFKCGSLQMVSFTITEKGYALTDLSGKVLPAVSADMEKGPQDVRHVISTAAALLYERFLAGGAPLALLSLDNCSHNGEKLRASVLKIAQAWRRRGFVGEDFLGYLSDESVVSFPWSMIDKITPRPSEAAAFLLEKDGLQGMDIVQTSRNTYIAPFVNAEIPQYLVVEDNFPAGRPPLQEAGVYFTDRETVDKVERMKVTTCLNPLHTALAVYGCLLGYTSIAEEMKDTELKALVEKIGYEEGMPVVVDPGILSPAEFLREVIEDRLPNPYIPDTPQRIACDTSQKMAVRFGETIKSYLADDNLDPSVLTGIPLVAAGWFRYLMAVDDGGKHMELSSDPMLPELTKALEGAVLGSGDKTHPRLKDLLSSSRLFGVDLYQAGIAGKIETIYRELTAGAGAVREVLKKYLKT